MSDLSQPARYSLVICTCNRLPLLKSCLQSCRNQTSVTFPWEVIVVDNNSQDQTAQFCRSEVSKWVQPRLRYRFLQEQNLSLARNHGYRLAEGQWIIYIDDDARLDPLYIQNMDIATGRSPKASCFGGIIQPEYESPPPEWLVPILKGYLSLQDFGKTPQRYRKHQFPYGCNLAIRKDALDRLQGFDNRLRHGEDKDIVMRLKQCGDSAWYHPSLKVLHFIPDSRMQLTTLSKLAQRTGEWEYQRCRLQGRWKALITLLEMGAKWLAALLLGLYYLVQGKSTTMSALIRYRTGFIQGCLRRIRINCRTRRTSH